MAILKEFKEFAVKGNVVDMAVGIIVGGAFGKIVSSFVNDVVMPPIGLLIGGVDFKDLQLVIQESVTEGDAVIQELVAIRYGSFIQTIIDFTIIAFVIFLAIKGINHLKRQEEAKPAAPPTPPAPSNEEKLLMEIRDALKKK
jgi:large conductance mechanosensitive channel